MIRTEEILARIRRAIAEEQAAASSAPTAAEDDSLPAISSRPELEYLNRNYALFDPASPMTSHRRLLGAVVVKLRWRLRHLVLGVLDRYFEKERLFLLELVRFANALAERSDRLLRELTERTAAVAERNDLFLGALDLRVEALEASEQMRRAETASPAPAPGAPSESAAILGEMAVALGGDVGARLRPFVERGVLAGTVLVTGCGDGAVLAVLGSGGTATGSEASATLVARARAGGHAVELADADAALRARAGRSLDAVVITGLCDRHALAAWPGLVAAAFACLRAGGHAVFDGLAGDREVERLRWLLARQRFAIVAVEPASGGDGARVVVARRGDGG